MIFNVFICCQLHYALSIYFVYIIIISFSYIYTTTPSGVSDLASTHPTALCDALRSYARFGGESDRASAHYPDIRYLRALLYCR